jgi:hypothetical protein
LGSGLFVSAIVSSAIAIQGNLLSNSDQ